MKKVKACDLQINDSIVATVTANGKGIYGTFRKPLRIDSIFMNVKIGNCFPSDNIIRFNVNNQFNQIRQDQGGVSFHQNESVWISS